jgi:DNA-binding NarL/FixJ family response regulator
MKELTEREHRIARMLANMHTVEQIAHELNIKRRTVHFHLQNIYRKLDYPPHQRNQTRLAHYYYQWMVK